MTPLKAGQLNAQLIRCCSLLHFIREVTDSHRISDLQCFSPANGCIVVLNVNVLNSVRTDEITDSHWRSK
jgi:hypothetical protein